MYVSCDSDVMSTKCLLYRWPMVHSVYKRSLFYPWVKTLCQYFLEFFICFLLKTELTEGILKISDPNSVGSELFGWDDIQTGHVVLCFSFCDPHLFWNHLNHFLSICTLHGWRISSKELFWAKGSFGHSPSTTHQRVWHQTAGETSAESGLLYVKRIVDPLACSWHSTAITVNKVLHRLDSLACYQL